MIKHSPISDNEHTAESARTEASIFEARVERYQSALFAYLGRLGLSQASAQDVAQETFLRVWSARDRFDDNRGRWSTWLFSIARNTALSYLDRPATKNETADTDLIERIPTTETGRHADNLHRQRWLRHALLQLGTAERELIALAYIEGLTSKEAADLLGCSEGAYRTRLSRARQRLKTLLDASNER